MSGLFITFEGVEGSGKSTQLARIARRLAGAGRDVVATREPGGTALGRRLRGVLLERDGAPIGPRVELLLYVADRAQHVAEVIAPALRRGAVVLSDRFLDATIAYQGYGRGLGREAVLALHRESPLNLRPDRTVLLDLDPVSGLGRARSRNEADGTDLAEGRFESEEVAFHRAVRRGYLALASEEPGRIRLVDAVGPEDAVEERVRAALSDLLPSLRDPVP
ncbi:MAG: dTMP kinase [Acidobacteriia bacterium]|nr:dTMP kinase [Terriglobia bacterium]